MKDLFAKVYGTLWAGAFSRRLVGARSLAGATRTSTVSSLPFCNVTFPVSFPFFAVFGRDPLYIHGGFF